MAEHDDASNDRLFKLFEKEQQRAEQRADKRIDELKADLKADLAQRIGDLADRIQEGQSSNREDSRRIGILETKVATLATFDPKIFVTKDEFYPVRRTHYLINGLIITAFILAIAGLVFVRGGGAVVR